MANSSIFLSDLKFEVRILGSQEHQTLWQADGSGYAPTECRGCSVLKLMFIILFNFSSVLDPHYQAFLFRYLLDIFLNEPFWIDFVYFTCVSAFSFLVFFSVNLIISIFFCVHKPKLWLYVISFCFHVLFSMYIWEIEFGVWGLNDRCLHSAWLWGPIRHCHAFV